MPLKADISDDGKRIILDSEFVHEDRIRALIGAACDKTTEKWSVPLTWSACTSLWNDFRGDFEASDALTEWGYNHLNEYIGPSRELRALDSLDSVDTSKSGRYAELVRTVRDFGRAIGLHPYQQVGAVFLALGEQRLLFDEMGTGKTAQTISALRALVETGENPFPALVVAPSSVKHVWVTQLEKWYPGLTVVNVKGTAVQRRKQLATPAHVYIVSYNAVSKHSKLAKSPGANAIRRCPDCGGFDEKITEDKCQAHVRELNLIDFRTVIVDEAHRITSPKSGWTRAIWSVSDKASYRYALTGTPIQPYIDDLWALLRFMKPDDFMGKTAFIDRYAETEYSPWGTFQITGIKTSREDEFHKIVTPYYRRVLKEVALPFLPPIQLQRRMVDMTGAQAKAYRDMKKKMSTELSSGTLTALDALTQANRLLQLSSSYLEVLDPVPGTEDMDGEETVKVRLAAPSNKVSAFMEDVLSKDFDESTKGVVVFAQSRQLLEMLAHEMDRAEIKYGMVTGAQGEDARSKAVDAFQAGETKYILVSIAAGGAGLTLTAADTMVFLQRSWSSVDMEQAQARAHRLGSEIHESIRIIHYLTEGTIESDQLDTLMNKDIKIEEVLRDEESLKAWLAQAVSA